MKYFDLLLTAFLLLALLFLAAAAFNGCDVFAGDLKYNVGWGIYDNATLDSSTWKPIDNWALFVFDVHDTTGQAFMDPALFNDSTLIAPPWDIYPNSFHGFYNADSLAAINPNQATIEYLTQDDGRYISVWVFAVAYDGQLSPGVGTNWARKPDLRLVKPSGNIWIVVQ